MTPMDRSVNSFTEFLAARWNAEMGMGMSDTVHLLKCSIVLVSSFAWSMVYDLWSQCFLTDNLGFF